MNRSPLTIEGLVGGILAGGMIVTTVLLVGGLVFSAVISGSIGEFSPAPTKTIRDFFLSVPGLVEAPGSAPGILIDFGIAMLLLTPYISILAAMLFFLFREHNRKFAAISGFLFVILTWILFFR